MGNRRPVPPQLFFGAGDFPARLDRLKAASGLSWDGMAACLGVDPRQLQRWRHDTAPCGDALFGIFRLGARVPGGLYLLLPDDLPPPGKPGGVQGRLSDF